MKPLWRRHQLLQCTPTVIECQATLSGFGYWVMGMGALLSLLFGFAIMAFFWPTSILRSCHHTPSAQCTVQTHFLGRAPIQDTIPLRLIERVEVNALRNFKSLSQTARFQVQFVTGQNRFTFWGGLSNSEAELWARKIRTFLKSPQSPPILVESTSTHTILLGITLLLAVLGLIPVGLLVLVIIVRTDCPDANGFQVFPQAHYRLDFQAKELHVLAKTSPRTYPLKFLRGFQVQESARGIRLYLDFDMGARYLDLHLSPTEQAAFVASLAVLPTGETLALSDSEPL
jgi:hypothetical protein